jgi:hypothetical protein
MVDEIEEINSAIRSDSLLDLLRVFLRMLRRVADGVVALIDIVLLSYTDDKVDKDDSDMYNVYKVYIRVLEDVRANKHNITFPSITADVNTPRITPLHWRILGDLFANVSEMYKSNPENCHPHVFMARCHKNPDAMLPPVFSDGVNALVKNARVAFRKLPNLGRDRKDATYIANLPKTALTVIRILLNLPPFLFDDRILDVMFVYVFYLLPLNLCIEPSNGGFVLIHKTNRILRDPLNQRLLRLTSSVLPKIVMNIEVSYDGSRNGYKPSPIMISPPPIIAQDWIKYPKHMHVQTSDGDCVFITIARCMMLTVRDLDQIRARVKAHFGIDVSGSGAGSGSGSSSSTTTATTTLKTENDTVNYLKNCLVFILTMLRRFLLGLDEGLSEKFLSLFSSTDVPMAVVDYTRKFLGEAKWSITAGLFYDVIGYLVTDFSERKVQIYESSDWIATPRIVEAREELRLAIEAHRADRNSVNLVRVLPLVAEITIESLTWETEVRAGIDSGIGNNNDRRHSTIGNVDEKGRFVSSRYISDLLLFILIVSNRSDGSGGKTDIKETISIRRKNTDNIFASTYTVAAKHAEIGPDGFIPYHSWTEGGVVDDAHAIGLVSTDHFISKRGVLVLGESCYRNRQLLSFDQDDNPEFGDEGLFFK